MTHRIIHQVMTPAVTTHENLTATEGAALMKQKHIGSLLIVDSNNKLIGLATERDIIYKVVAEGHNPCKVHLSDIMTKEPLTISSNKPFVHALHLMHEYGFRHVPVVDNGNLVGMLSLRDALSGDMLELEKEQEVMDDIAEILA